MAAECGCGSLAVLQPSTHRWAFVPLVVFPPHQDRRLTTRDQPLPIRAAARGLARREGTISLDLALACLHLSLQLSQGQAGDPPDCVPSCVSSLGWGAGHRPCPAAMPGGELCPARRFAGPACAESDGLPVQEAFCQTPSARPQVQLTEESHAQCGLLAQTLVLRPCLGRIRSRSGLGFR